jgi:hypothetical protein
MAAEFVPFPRYEFAPASASALPEFLAVTPPVDTKSSVVVPADKALADLSEALRMGLDEAIIETILSGIRSPRILTKTRPISLRDLYAPEVVPPVKTQEPKAPGIVVTRVGDLVQKVTVECPCGERISLDCVY